MLLAEANQRSELGDGVPVDESSQFTTPNSSILFQEESPNFWHLPVRLIKLTDACLVHQDHLKDTTDMELDSSRGLGPSQPKPQTNMGYYGIRPHMTRDFVIQLDTDSL